MLRRIKLSVLALLMAAAASLGFVASPAAAGDTGWQLRGFNNGSASYGPCQAYLRTFDTPFGHTVGQIHGWTDCDMYGGTQFVQVDAANRSDRFYSFAGRYVGHSQTWDFVGSFNGTWCVGTTVQIHGAANRVNC